MGNRLNDFLISNSDHTLTVSVDVFKPLKVLDFMFFYGSPEATKIRLQPEFLSPDSSP
jgi:hypothetical protein